MILLQKNINTQQKIIHLYMLTMFGIFPLYLTPVRIQELSVKGILFCALTLAAAAAYIALLFQRRAVFRKRFCRLDICMLVMFMSGIWNICVQLFRTGGNYGLPLLGSISVFAYFMISASGDDPVSLFRLSYLDLFLAACAVIYLTLLARGLLFPQRQGTAWLLEGDALQSFLLLSLTVCILQYCNNRKAGKDKLYLVLSTAGFLLLSAQNNIWGLLLIGALFLLNPLLFVPTAEMVRRNLILTFLFLFILSNMPLLTHYTEWIKTEIQYTMRNSMVINLLLAAVGAAVLSYWRRLPGGVPLDAVVMRRLQKAFAFAMKLYCIFMAGILTAGRLGGIEGRMGADMIKALQESLYAGILQADGTFRQMLQEYGVPGIVWAGILFSLMIARLRRLYRQTPDSAILTILSVMFMLQSLFYKQQIVTTPIYVILTTFALFQCKQKEEYSGKDNL